jgi:hypothetical protein
MGGTQIMDAEKLVRDTTAIVLELRKCREEKPEDVKATLERLITKSSEVFGIITDHQNMFFDGTEKHISWYYSLLDKTTACYAYLVPIVFTLRALEKNRAVRYFHSEKIACEKAGNKFISGATEKEADFFVQEENYVANIFEGFMNSCMQIMQTCRVRIREVEGRDV